MGDSVQEKSRGLKFAEQQLLRHGWEKGKGLGRQENGISEAIRVKVKCDKGGVGHKQGEQFTFHWWDHVFNKASASLQVESDQNGIKVKKTVEEDEDCVVSNKKPRKAALAKTKLYGCFVKSATLRSGEEQPEPECPSSGDTSSLDDEDDQRLDLSSTTKLSDADLMKACGGRTAHKGARHGLTMNAKLARLEQQEAEFMAKYSKKSQSANPSAEHVVQSADGSPEEEDAGEVSQGKKAKRNKSNEHLTETNCNMVSESPEIENRPKKKKKKRGNLEEVMELVPPEEELNPVDPQTVKRKPKKRKRLREENGEVREETGPTLNSECVGRTSETDTKRRMKKKKKKVSSKEQEEHLAPAAAEQANDTESKQSDSVQDCNPKKKKKNDAAAQQQGDVVEKESPDKHKRKKKKKTKKRIDCSRSHKPEGDSS